jgi:hypothetical protein
MSLIQQRIASLLNGISQRPQEQRQPSEADVQLNALSHPVRGLMKRPPFRFLAKLASVSNDYSDAFTHNILRDESEKYHVVLSNGDVQVFDAITGEEVTVLNLAHQHGVSVSNLDDGYLTDSADAGFRAATAGDTTIVVNRGIATKRGSTKTLPKTFDSLIYIRQADYGTTYRVTINGIQVAIQTVTGATADARPDISTERVAADLLSALQSKPELANFVFTLFGSTISIANIDHQDYTLVVADGLADQGLRAVKGSVQAFEDLPRRAPNGFRVEIAGDPNSNLDNYWVQFDDTKGPDQTGVWIECPAPSTIVDFDPATLPHRLVRLGAVLSETPHVGLKGFPGAKIVGINAVDKLRWVNLITNGVSGVSAPNTVSGNALFTTLLIVKDNNDGAWLTLDATFSKLVFPFIVDTTVVVPGNEVFVTLYKNGVEIDRLTYEPGKAFFPPNQVDIDKQEALVNDLKAQIAAIQAKITNNFLALIYAPTLSLLQKQLTDAEATLQQMELTQAQANTPTSFTVDTDVSGNPAGQPGDVFKIVLTYTLGENMDTGVAGALQAFHKASLILKTINGVEVPTKQIIFSDDLLYPAGVEVVVVINGNTYTYTVPFESTAEEVGTAVNVMLQAEGSITSTLDATSDARVNIFNNDSSIPDLAVTVGLDNRNVFSNPTLSMVTNVFAGFTLKNISDGSSGLIESNTSSSIKIQGTGPSQDIFLTGGVDNTFQPGDLCTVVGTGRYFVWEQCPWKERGAGDLTVGPFPSFIDNTIQDVAFYQNRLVFISHENIIFSAAGDLFNFFRFSGAQLLASDLIDVKAAHREVALFHSLVLWNEGLYAISESAEFLVTGEPVLTPTTVRIDVAGHVANKAGPRPLPLGNRLYLSRSKGGFTQVPELYVSDNTTAKLNGNDISADAPKYVKGSPLALEGDDQLGLLFVLTNEGKTIYVYKYLIDDMNGQRVQSSWSQWSVASGKIIGISLVDGDLAILVQEDDGFYLYRADLHVTLDADSATEEAFNNLDRRVDGTVSGFSETVSGSETVITLPYAIRTNGLDGDVRVVDRTNGIVYAPVSNGTASQEIVVAGVDLTVSGIDLFVGVLYRFRYKLSRLFWRGAQNGPPEVGGRLQLLHLDVYYHDTTDFKLSVKRLGRTETLIPVQLLAASSGRKRFPILGRNTYTDIELTSYSPGTCAFSVLDWEGEFTLRSQRV